MTKTITVTARMLAALNARGAQSSMGIASRRRFVTGALAFTCIGMAKREAEAQSAGTAIRIGIIPSEFAAQPWYANDLGMFAKAGIAVDIEPVTSGAAGIAAVASGALDLVYTNVLSLAIAVQKGIPVTALAAANIYSPTAWGSGVLAVKRTSKLNSAADFAGTTIAVNGLHNVLELGARAWLDSNGGDSSKVRWVELPDSEMETAVMSGRVDGAVMSAGVYPQLGKASYPIRIIALALRSIAPTFTVSVWATSRDWLAKHPVAARKLTAVLNESAAWANGHHHESAVILSKYTKRPLADIEASVRYVYGTGLTAASLQPQIDAAAKYGWLKAFPAREMLAVPAN